jgi:hypothetical protein
MQLKSAALNQPQYLIWGGRIPATGGANIMIFSRIAINRLKMCEIMTLEISTQESVSRYFNTAKTVSECIMIIT